jgi:hypothetical protein
VNPHFASLVIGIGQQAEGLMQGQTPEGLPEGASVREMARTMIDTLGMLQEKTAGQLEDDERQLIDEIVTGLRLRFVQSEPRG